MPLVPSIPLQITTRETPKDKVINYFYKKPPHFTFHLIPQHFSFTPMPMTKANFYIKTINYKSPFCVRSFTMNYFSIKHKLEIFNHKFSIRRKMEIISEIP